MDIRVIKGTHPAFDKESIRILSNFPRLIPAMKTENLCHMIIFNYAFLERGSGALFII